MVGVKRTPMGDYYVFFRDGSTEKFVRATNHRTGTVNVGLLSLPEELVGVVVRVKIEVVKDKEKEEKEKEKE